MQAIVAENCFNCCFSSLMFICTNGPPLRLFDAHKYMVSWIQAGRHSAMEATGKQQKSVFLQTHQKLFFVIVISIVTEIAVVLPVWSITSSLPTFGRRLRRSCISRHLTDLILDSNMICGWVGSKLDSTTPPNPITWQVLAFLSSLIAN